MKRVFSILLIALFCSGALPAAAQLSGAEILKKVDETAWVSTSRALTTQTVLSPGGEKREYKIEGITMDGQDKSMSLYLEPAKVAGVKILSLNDGQDVWTYFPNTGRVRKLASSAKKRRVMGSDFTYDDMASGTFTKKFTAKLLGEAKEAGRQCYQLELIPTPEGPQYGKLQIWVDKEKFISYRIDYWDEDMILLKRLTITDYHDIQGHPTPMRMEMENLQEGGRTVVVNDKVEYDLPLKKDDFSERNLKK